mgnify:CR=1 FL=1
MENWINRSPDESHQDQNGETHEISGSYYRKKEQMEPTGKK